MIRIYNTMIRDEDNETVQRFDQARRELMREQASRCGLTMRALNNVPDADEAFDGDFTQASRLLTVLIGYGLGSFRTSATTRAEHMKILDLYNGVSPVEVYVITEQAARYQESVDQADTTL